ncbi:MAG: efflux RND transporter periplasmic adaptor subunit [Rickettsiales bacterium]
MKKKVLVGACVAATLAALVGISYMRSERDGGRKDQFSTAVVRLGDMESLVTAKGTLEPQRYVDVGAQVSGLIEKMHKEAGDRVEEGELIAEIDPAVYLARVRGDEARLKNLLAQLREQRALAVQAAQKLLRAKKLIAGRAASQEALEDADAAFRVAEARVEALGAQIEEAESTLEGDKANLRFTKIYAPMSGVITTQSVKEGQTINANQTAPVIVQIADPGAMTARAQVAEADVMKLSEDTPVYFTTLGSNDRKWEGAIRQILPSPEVINDVVLYSVPVDVKNEDRRLMSGMTAQMFFVLADARNVPIVPIAALGKRVPSADGDKGNGYETTVIGVKGKREARIVVVSLKDRAFAAVASGLKEGEVVELFDKKSDVAAPKPRGGMRF